jgi:uncharacterized protein
LNASSKPHIRVVIDTQTTLDWLLFRDPYTAAWRVPRRDWRWLATADMRRELAWVLERPWPDRVQQRTDRTLAIFDRLTDVVPPPTPLPSTPQCKDASDQMFIDLAVALAPSVLLSRDRAVLALAKRLARVSVTVQHGRCHDRFMSVV